jgi:hypothetical protein
MFVFESVVNLFTQLFGACDLSETVLCSCKKVRSTATFHLKHLGKHHMTLSSLPHFWDIGVMKKLLQHCNTLQCHIDQILHIILAFVFHVYCMFTYGVSLIFITWICLEQKIIVKYASNLDISLTTML